MMTGWPHFIQLKALPEYNMVEQENFLKDHILLYFENIGEPFKEFIKYPMKKFFYLLFLLLSCFLLGIKKASVDHGQNLYR